ncbi:hypothetical protein MKW92_047928 [Papaver armeniacum]|nr:hypothetical protein MKW92_047928 [Papaver armeniacum]
MLYVTTCFVGHTIFHKALKEAFEVFCKKVIAGSSSCKLLAYIIDKHLFAEFYRKKLACRLLFGTSANDDHERSILSKLKQQCGGQFTSKMEGMVTDLHLAKDNQSEFEKFQKVMKKPIELVVTTYQASLLLLFNSSDKLTYSEILSQLNFSDDDVVRLLHSLTKEPNTKKISQKDSFMFNAEFTDKMMIL